MPGGLFNVLNEFIVNSIINSDPAEELTITRLFLGNANAYIVKSGKEAAIIDGGLGSWPERFRTALADNSGALADVRYIMVTHAHYDHVGSVKALKRAYPDALVVAHKNEAANLRAGLSPVPKGTMWFSRPISWLGCRIFRHCIHFNGFAVDLEVEDSLIRELGGTEIEFFHTPGHTSGSLCLRVGKEAVFVGDTIFHVLPACFYPPFADLPERLIASWQRIAATGARMIHPGHGRSFSRTQFVARNGYF